jgi:hypothetical protein
MSIIETQETQEESTVDMRSIINDIRHNVLTNYDLRYKLRYLGENIWTLRIRNPNANRCARVEIIIDEYADPEDRGARGAVFTYGDISRVHIDLILNSIMERI